MQACAFLTKSGSGSDQPQAGGIELDGFFACRDGVFAGFGGGVGQEGVAEGLPAGAGVGEFADRDDGVDVVDPVGVEKAGVRLELVL